MGIYVGNDWIVHSSRFGTTLTPMKGWYATRSRGAAALWSKPAWSTEPERGSSVDTTASAKRSRVRDSHDR